VVVAAVALTALLAQAAWLALLDSPLAVAVPGHAVLLLAPAPLRADLQVVPVASVAPGRPVVSVAQVER
jgi:hypothetical protein